MKLVKKIAEQQGTKLGRKLHTKAVSKAIEYSVEDCIDTDKLTKIILDSAIKEIESISKLNRY